MGTIKSLADLLAANCAPGTFVKLATYRRIELFGRGRIVGEVMAVDGAPKGHFRFCWQAPADLSGGNGPGNTYGGCCLGPAMTADEIRAAIASSYAA